MVKETDARSVCRRPLVIAVRCGRWGDLLSRTEFAGRMVVLKAFWLYGRDIKLVERGKTSEAEAL
jgi:hypothetical protein